MPYKYQTIKRPSYATVTHHVARGRFRPFSGVLPRSVGHEIIAQKRLSRRQIHLGFYGYGDESDHTVLELTHNWDTSSYDLGNAYGHIAIEVEDAYAACDAARAKGGNVVREAGPMKHGTTVIAFVEDPDGYKIEFIQKNSGND